MSESTKTIDPKQFTQHDIYAAQKRIKTGNSPNLDYKKTYDAEFFWQDLGEEYFKRFQKQEMLQINIGWLIDVVKTLKCETLIDIGCGFGRVLPFLIESKTVKSCHGVDIAQNILNCHEKYLEPSKVEVKNKAGDIIKAPDYRDLITFSIGDGRHLKDIESNSYDCALSSEVLQHTAPEDIERFCQELVRVSKVGVICIERWGFPSEHAEPHIWSHNLADVFEKLGLRVAQVTTVSNGQQGIVALKRS